MGVLFEIYYFTFMTYYLKKIFCIYLANKFIVKINKGKY